MTPAQKRAALILQVSSGQITATEAARQLGISRQRFYEWQQRGLNGLMKAVEDQPTGRPKRETDPEKEQLQDRVKELETTLALEEKRQMLREILSEWAETELHSKKNPK